MNIKVCVLIAASFFTFAASSYAVDYAIDPDHSSVTFKIKHLAISTVPGRFSNFSGEFSYDPANVAASKASATIEAKSVSTEQKKRDDHLRGSDFFDVEKFPNIAFKTTSVEAAGSEAFKAHGDLTIHGVTKPVTLDVKFGGAAKDPWGKERAAFAATTQINRKDFGLSWSKTMDSGALVLGDTVDVALEIEGIKK